MTWIAPITDRTQADITNRTARGFLNAADLNRIEGNIVWLTNQLARFNYFADTPSTTTWHMVNVPVISDFVRIRNNINTLIAYTQMARPDIRASFHTIGDGAFTQLNFTTVNMLETNIYLLRQVIDRMSIIYRQASFESGQQLFLPQRRV